MNLGISWKHLVSLWDVEGLMDSLVALCLVLLFTYSSLYGYLLLTIPWPREQGPCALFLWLRYSTSISVAFSGSASPYLSRGLQTAKQTVTSMFILKFIRV